MPAVTPNRHTSQLGLALRHGFAVITPDDILWVEAAGSGTRLHLMTGEILDAMLCLLELETRLPLLKFCKVRSGCLVNLQYVLDLTCEPESCLWMEGGIGVPLPDTLPEALGRRVSAAIEHNRILQR
jgi:DNA-binding LytR/AlgR family response regulator